MEDRRGLARSPYSGSMAHAGLFAGSRFERPVTCERCSVEVAACKCPRDAAGKLLLAAAQKVRVRREKRNGKFVTVITGLDGRANDLPAMLKQLKSSLGAGGTLNEANDLELQGDHAQAMVDRFRKLGFDAKRAGG